jgi:hypothetical protein
MNLTGLVALSKVTLCYEHQASGLDTRFGSAALAHRLSFVSSHVVFLSSFFRFVVLVTAHLYDLL